MIPTTDAGPASARLRIDELAQLSGVASGTIRFYQREGLIPPPEREGRVAFYDPEHLHRLERIRAFQEQGLPLAVIGGLLEREERGEDVAGWLALDAAVFAPAAAASEAVPDGAFDRLGLEPEDIEALAVAGLIQRENGRLEATPGLLELTTRLIEAGVQPRTISAGAALVAERLRAVAEAMGQLGWDVFAPERQRIEADEPVAEEVLAKLEEMRGLAQRIVATLFPRLLDEMTRTRVEGYAEELAGRRRADQQTGESGS